MPEPSKTNPIRETNDEARSLARALIEEAQFAAIAVLEPGTAHPLVSRIAVAMEEDGSPFFLASQLAGHTKALAADGRASILFGEPKDKGDPLIHPRVTIIGQVNRLSHDDSGHGARRAFWLKKHPKAKLYIDFADFHFFRMTVERANLNGGFGQAFELTAQDLQTPTG